MSETRPLEEAELGVNDLSVCKGHGSKGTGMIGSGKTPLTPWQSLPRVICSLPLSSLLSGSLFSPPFPRLSLTLVLSLPVCLLLSVPVVYSGCVCVSVSLFISPNRSSILRLSFFLPSFPFPQSLSPFLCEPVSFLIRPSRHRCLSPRVSLLLLLLCSVSSSRWLIKAHKGASAADAKLLAADRKRSSTCLLAKPWGKKRLLQAINVGHMWSNFWNRILWSGHTPPTQTTKYTPSGNGPPWWQCFLQGDSVPWHITRNFSGLDWETFQRAQIVDPASKFPRSFLR